tara:strand:+ start:3267 stop:3410 length:144 start_codon:yes stop_codon:yes gene_type:complete
MGSKVKYSKIPMRDAQIDRYLTKAQQTLPPDLQAEIVKSKKKKDGGA